MTQQLVNIGTLANDGTGDTLRDAFDKTNQNFTDLYSKFTETVITASGSVDALRVTNTGTGNSLLIEDSSNPDSSPFVIDNAGLVGIGTATPTTKLTISNNTVLPSAGAPAGTNLWQVGVDATQNLITLDGFANSNSVIFRRASGTAASPSAVTSNATIGAISARGYGATGYSSVSRAQMLLVTSEAWTDSAQGARITFLTTQIGTTSLTEKMRIDDAGNVGIGTTSPSGYGKFAVVGVAGTPILNYNDGTITGTAGYTSGGVAYSGSRSNHPIGFLTNDTPRMQIDTSGNVGIGNTPSGTYKLEVTGNGYFSTNLTVAGAITNSRIDTRTSSLSGSAGALSVSPDVSAYDVYNCYSLAGTVTIASPTGTPVGGQKLLFRFLDNGTSRTITWTSSWPVVIGVTLPTATTASKVTYVGMVYSATSTRWEVIAVTTQA